MNAQELRAKLPKGLARRALAVVGHRPSAVLVGLEPDHGVWLTRRAPWLPSHAGQVSFPGGKIEATDASPEAAALREAAEEIGLDPARAEVLGCMDDFITGTGFHISPVVALLPVGVGFVASPGEVQEVFCLPFSTLLDKRFPERRRAFWRGGERNFWVWPHPDHPVWGATAKILLNLAMLLRGAE